MRKNHLRSGQPARLFRLSLCLLFAGSMAAAQQITFPAPPPLLAQNTAPLDLPDAPGYTSISASPDVDEQTASSSQAKSQQQNQGTNPPQSPDAGPSKRLFFIIPNFRSVRTTTVLPPQTVREKFVDASEDTFDYSAIALDVLLAAYNYGRTNTPEFGTGGVAYGRYLWHSAADQAVENYLVEFIVPTVTHEDTRFYQLGRGGFAKRSLYAVSRTFITKSDSGHETVNLGEIVGAAASSGISQLYYPGRERTFGNFADQYGTDLLIDAAAYFLREFEPEFSRALAHKKPAQSH